MLATKLKLRVATYILSQLCWQQNYYSEWQRIFYHGYVGNKIKIKSCNRYFFTVMLATKLLLRLATDIFSHLISQKITIKSRTPLQASRSKPGKQTDNLSVVNLYSF
jgi:hypothetical protein